MSPSYADSYFVNLSGNMCVPPNAIHGADVGYWMQGTTNASTTTSRQAICPYSTPSNFFGGLTHNLHIQGIDGNSTQPFFCMAFRSTSFGGTVWSTTRYSCSSAGGCTDNTSSFTGPFYLKWIKPFPGVTSSSSAENVGIWCTLPPSEAGVATWIGSYDLLTQ